MKKPSKAMLLLNRNRVYLVDNIHFDTSQVTLKESEKVYNTIPHWFCQTYRTNTSRNFRFHMSF